MAGMAVRTVVERGTKGKRAVAFSLDWPGWSRGARSPELALETLESYRDRYRPIVEIAGMTHEFDAAGPLEVVEDRVGTGSTDFWGISFSPSSTEHGPLDAADLERRLTLLQACWTFFDGVAARVSPEMRKGPRGGGRDRDKILAHVVNAEASYIRKLGIRASTAGQDVPDPVWRPAVLDAVRSAQDSGALKERGWTARYAARRIAWHVLDHAWEIEDKSET